MPTHQNHRSPNRRPAKRRRHRKTRIKWGAVLCLCAVIAVIALSIKFFVMPAFATLAANAAVEEEPQATEAPLQEEIIEEDTVYTIVLDSGHSTYNAGAHGIVNEEDITAQTTEYLRLLLEADENYEVILTHEYDVYIGIADRRQVAIDAEADFFISIHCNINSMDDSISGFEIYVQLPENENHEISYAVASLIRDAFIENGHTARSSTGLYYCRYVTDEDGNDTQYVLTEYEDSVTDLGGETYGVIKSDEYPGILIEQGYVNSQTDVDNWMSDEGMQTAANIYYEALCEYFGTEPCN